MNTISRKPGLVGGAVSFKSVRYLLKYQESIDSNNSKCSYGTFTKFCTINACTWVVAFAEFRRDYIRRILETDISWHINSSPTKCHCYANEMPCGHRHNQGLRFIQKTTVKMGNHQRPLRAYKYKIMSSRWGFGKLSHHWWQLQKMVCRRYIARSLFVPMLPYHQLVPFGQIWIKIQQYS